MVRKEDYSQRTKIGEGEVHRKTKTGILHRTQELCCVTSVQGMFVELQQLRVYLA